MSNVGGAGALAADACTDLGLTVHRPHGLTGRRLRALVPAVGAVGGPVDTTAAIPAENFRQCLELLAADDEVDALIAVVLPTAATGDLTAAIQQAEARVPMAAVILGQSEPVRLIPRADGDGQIPAYADPEAAAAAMARAARYGAWRTEPRGQVPSFPDVAAEDARAAVREFLHATLGGGWMPPERTAELLRCYGIPLAELTPARSEDEAVRAFEAAGGAVVLKADVPGLLHKSDAGGVELDLRSEADVRDAYRTLTGRFGERQGQVLVQPMIAGGTEVIVGVADDHMFGPLVVFGPGGVAADAPGRYAARLTPLTDTDADRLIGSIRSGAAAARPSRQCSPGGPARRPRSAARPAAPRVAARRRPARGHRARPQPGHRPAGRGVRGGRADQGDALPGAGPVPAAAALSRRPVPGDGYHGPFGKRIFRRDLGPGTG